jgi:hypothetical protein
MSEAIDGISATLASEIAAGNATDLDSARNLVDGCASGDVGLRGKYTSQVYGLWAANGYSELRIKAAAVDVQTQCDNLVQSFAQYPSA